MRTKEERLEKKELHKAKLKELEKSRVAVFRSWVCGSTFKEIGVEFGISPQSANAKVVKTLRLLKMFFSIGRYPELADMCLEGFVVETIEQYRIDTYRQPRLNRKYGGCQHTLYIYVPGGVKRNLGRMYQGAASLTELERMADNIKRGDPGWT
jgi:hypothetical protein